MALERYTNRNVVEPVGVVRLQDDATAASRSLIQATDATAKTALNTLALTERAYIDEFQIKQREKLIELRTKFQNDPEGFKSAWQAHAEGTLSAVPGGYSRAAKSTLGEIGTSGYSSLVEFQNANARRNAASNWETAKTLIENDYLAATRTKNRAEMEKKAREYALHLESGRGLQLVDEVGMAQQRDRLYSMGAAAIAADDIEAAWRKGGMAAARKKMKEFETDPAYSAARDKPTTFSALKTEAWSRVRELEADAARGRAAATEGLDLHITRASEGLPLDYDALRKYQAVLDPKSRAGKIVNTLIEKAPVIDAFRGASLQDQAAELANLDRAIEDPKAPNLESLNDQRRVLRAIHSRALSAYKSDSFTYTNRIHAKQEVGEIDFARPEANAAELAKRRQIVEAHPEAGIPFSREEMGRFASTWNAASPNDKARIAAGMNDNLGSTLTSRVLSTLSKDGNVDAATVYAAGVARHNAVLARDIYDGQAVLSDPKIKNALGEEKEFARVFNEEVRDAFGRLPGTEDARRSAYEATRALAAHWAKNNSKLGQDIPGDEYRRLVRRAVGSIVTHNGSALFPPSRDMTQRDFDAMLSRVRDQDAPPLRALDGSVKGITSRLRGGVLESIGDGRYIIRAAGGYVLDPKDPGRYYVIDRDFFDRVRTREQYEDFGDTSTGQPPRRRTAPQVGPLGVPVETERSFDRPRGGVTGME